MKRFILRRLICGALLALIFNQGYAEEPILPPQTPQYPSFETAQADWIFTGIVNNERGEAYHYYFELQKNNNQYQAIASITEGETKKLVLYEKTQAILEPSIATQWQVGSLYLTFNPITNSWAFGLQKQNNKGFQFKVDMLGQSTKAQSIKPKELRPGIKFSVSQAGLLHGYLQTGERDKDNFVTAAKSWFQQIWVSTPQTLDHTLVGVLCEFNNGNSFYAMNLKETDATEAAIAGWENEKGEPTPVSQFITIEALKEKTWSIDLASPKLHLNIEDLVPNEKDKQPLVIGASEGLPGFCSITQSVIVG